MIEINKNIPVPADRTRKYPWSEMKVGYSFLLPRDYHYAYQLAWKASKRYAPKLFKVKSTSEGYRCWRVK